jgi:beta-phosphoglucomutase-like phosphatase (HAD superfamily)
VFLIAATRLGVAPEHCIVVEDAQHGIEAARAAGMKSIGVNQNDKQLSADVVVRSLEFLDANVFDTLLRNG